LYVERQRLVGFFAILLAFDYLVIEIYIPPYFLGETLDVSDTPSSIYILHEL
jgi:hypothetical protein